MTFLVDWWNFKLEFVNIFQLVSFFYIKTLYILERKLFIDKICRCNTWLWITKCYVTLSLLKVFATFAANMPCVSLGMNMGFSAIALPQLEGEDSEIKITTEEASWIGKLTFSRNLLTPFLLYLFSIMIRQLLQYI